MAENVACLSSLKKAGLKYLSMPPNKKVQPPYDEVEPHYKEAKMKYFCCAFLIGK